MTPSPRLLGFFAALLMVASSTTSSFADITPENAHNDRAPFDACGAALDKFDDKVAGAASPAADACGKSTAYYGKKFDAAKTEDDSCLNGLYAGSSAARWAHVLKSGTNQAPATKVLGLANQSLTYVIANCPHNPNIVKSAKFVLASFKDL